MEKQIIVNNNELTGFETSKQHVLSVNNSVLISINKRKYLMNILN